MSSVAYTNIEQRQLSTLELPGLGPRRLLGMPVEIQLMIYKYTLDSPCLWERRHRPGCHRLPNRSDKIDLPPFIWQRSFIDAILPKEKSSHKRTAATNSDNGEGTSKTTTAAANSNTNTDNDNDNNNESSAASSSVFPTSFVLLETTSFCKCAVRPGINLLLTNRFVFSIAAPLFWSRNTFCFSEAAEFVACMSVTSPGTRALIRSVSVVSLDASVAVTDARTCLRVRAPAREIVHGRHKPYHHQHSQRQQKPSTDDATTMSRHSRLFEWADCTRPMFWDAVGRLHGLRRLAVPSDFLETFTNDELDGAERFVALLTAAPHLMHIDLTEMNFYGGGRAMERRDYFYANRARFWELVYDAPGDCGVLAAYAGRVDLGRPKSEWSFHALRAIEDWHDQELRDVADSEINRQLLMGGPTASPRRFGSWGSIPVFGIYGKGYPRAEVALYSRPLTKAAHAADSFARAAQQKRDHLATGDTNWFKLHSAQMKEFDVLCNSRAAHPEMPPEMLPEEPEIKPAKVKNRRAGKGKMIKKNRSKGHHKGKSTQ